MLADIDTPEIDAQLTAAKAKLNAASATVKVRDAEAQFAKTTYARWRNSPRGVVSVQEQEAKQADYESGVARVNAAKADMAVAQADVDRLESLESFKQVVAPFDGVVTARETDIGALINAGSAGNARELFSVADTHKVRIYVKVPQRLTGNIHRGLSAELRLPQYPGKVFAAKATTTSRSVNTSSRTLLVELQAENLDGLLRPGTYVEARLNLPSDPNTVLIPASAILFRQHGLEVAVVGDDDKITLKKISLGRNSVSRLKLPGGLMLADQVVDSPPEFTCIRRRRADCPRPCLSQAAAQIRSRSARQLMLRLGPARHSAARDRWRLNTIETKNMAKIVWPTCVGWASPRLLQRDRRRARGRTDAETMLVLAPDRSCNWFFWMRGRSGLSVARRHAPSAFCNSVDSESKFSGPNGAGRGACAMVARPERSRTGCVRGSGRCVEFGHRSRSDAGPKGTNPEVAVIGAALPHVGISAGIAAGTGTDLTKGRVANSLRAGSSTAGLETLSEIVGFDGGWELDIFGKYRRLLEATRDDTQALAEMRHTVLITVIADVVRTYINIRGLEARLEFARNNFATAQKTLDIVQTRFDRGLTSEFDVTWRSVNWPSSRPGHRT